MRFHDEARYDAGLARHGPQRHLTLHHEAAMSGGTQVRAGNGGLIDPNG